MNGHILKPNFGGEINKKKGYGLFLGLDLPLQHEHERQRQWHVSVQIQVLGEGKPDRRVFRG